MLVRRVKRDAGERRGAQHPGSRWLRPRDWIPSTLPRGPALLAVVVAALAGFVGWHWVARPAPIDERMPVASTDGSDGSPVGGPPSGSASPEPADAPRGSGDRGASLDAGGGPGGDQGGGEVTLHVAGAVNRPGLVSVAEGSRIADAAAAAGGLTADADVERVNLAAVVLDGSRVFIPAVGQEIPPEIPVESASGTGGGEPGVDSPLDVNSADEEALEALPGVGPATAAAIVSHREEHGRFDTVEDLLDVRGIGEAKLDVLRDLVTVG